MDLPVVISAVATVGLVLTGMASTRAAVVSARAAERLEDLACREVAAREAGITVLFSGRLDTAAAVPRLTVVCSGDAVVVHGVALGLIDARTAGGAVHPGPHANPCRLQTAYELPRRLHRDEVVDFDWPEGAAERSACRGYGPASTVSITADYSIGLTGPIETRVVPVQFCSYPQPQKENTP